MTIEPEAAAAVTGAGWLAVLSVFVRRLLNEHDNKASKDELRAAILEAKERDIRAEHSRERLFAELAKLTDTTTKLAVSLAMLQGKNDGADSR